MVVVGRNPSEGQRSPASRISPPLSGLTGRGLAMPRRGKKTSLGLGAEVELTAVLFPYRRRCARCDHGTSAFVLTREGLPTCTSCYLFGPNS